MATNTVTTEQVREAIEQLAAMVAAGSISPQTVADILEMMRNLNDQERLKVIDTGEAYIQEILNTGIPAEKVSIDDNSNVKVAIEDLRSAFSILQGSYEDVSGTFVENGVIAADGSFSSNNGFTIKSYAVSEGDVLHIQTNIGQGASLYNRAQAAAYNGNTFVAVVASGSIVTDTVYIVPSGVSKICVYNINTESQKVTKKTSEGLIEDVADLKSRMSSAESEISNLKEDITPLLPTYEPLTGTFVMNGIILGDGSFSSNNGFTIKSYAVEEGNVVRAQTDMGQGATLRNRAQVAAYNGDTFVEVVSQGNIVTDITYTVPSGVNKICVYNINTASQSVDLKTGIDVTTDIPELKEESARMKGEIDSLQEFVGELENASEYNRNDFYTDDDNWKSYFYFLNYNVGQYAPTEPSKSPYADLWGCIRLPVTKGQKVLVKTIGGTNGRAYAVTDANRKILVVAPAGTDTTITPFEYEITTDGYLYVNCNPNTSTAFYVKVWKEFSSTLEQVEDNTERIDELEEQVNISSVPKINNPAYNLKKQSLKIFHIGNSFMDDSTNYLPGFIEAAGINTADMCLYCGIRSGGTYKNWYDAYHGTDEQNPTIYKKCGGINQTITSDGTIGSAFRSALRDNDWDIIIIQQNSLYSGEYKEWEGQGEGGYLQEFIRIIKLWQPDATIAFNLVHASPLQSGGGAPEKTQARWKGVAESCKWMVSNYGIDLIIPYGTAVENIRSSVLNTSSNGLTRDNHHLGHGLARYVANACYFQTIFASKFGVSVLGNSYRYTVTEQQREEAGTYASGCIDVTNENAEAAQMAAMLACCNMYEIINPDNIEI